MTLPVVCSDLGQAGNFPIFRDNIPCLPTRFLQCNGAVPRKRKTFILSRWRLSREIHLGTCSGFIQMPVSRAGSLGHCWFNDCTVKLDESMLVMGWCRWDPSRFVEISWDLLRFVGNSGCKFPPVEGSANWLSWVGILRLKCFSIAPPLGASCQSVAEVKRR